jgi:hypothetical protein
MIGNMDGDGGRDENESSDRWFHEYDVDSGYHISGNSCLDAGQL